MISFFIRASLAVYWTYYGYTNADRFALAGGLCWAFSAGAALARYVS